MATKSRKTTDSALTRRVKSKVRSLGADLVGIASPRAMEKYPEQYQWIERILPPPGTNAIIVAGVRIPSSALEINRENPRIAQFSTQGLYTKLVQIAQDLSLFLDDLGYRSAAIPTHLPVPMTKEGMGLKAEVSHRHTALEAGLGNFGINGLILTPEFGPRVRFVSILTDAPLAADKPLAERLCNDCLKCVKACPVQAIGEDGKVNVLACAPNNLKHGLPGLVRFATEIAKADPEKKKELIRSPEFWEYWQNLSTGIFYYCFECLRVCPIGKKKSKSNRSWSLRVRAGRGRGNLSSPKKLEDDFRRLQKYGAQKARGQGIKTEADVERIALRNK